MRREQREARARRRRVRKTSWFAEAGMKTTEIKAGETYFLTSPYSLGFFGNRISLLSRKRTPEEQREYDDLCAATRELYSQVKP